jgi:hypothetical protein
MSDSEFDKGVGATLIVFFIIAILIAVCSLIAWSYNCASHRFLGSAGGPCFANHTCRDGLNCVSINDSDEVGICVKK